MEETVHIMPIEESLSACIALLCDAKTITITAHVNPDGDAIGSELALYYLLRQLGKEVAIVNSSPTPYNLTFLPGSAIIREYQPERDEHLLMDVDIIVVLDVNNLKRLRTMEESVRQSPVRKIVIDHHLDPHEFADVYVVDYTACATSEILWRLTAALGDQYFTKELAEAMYTGIMTDTGNFRYPRTDAELFRMVARLVDAGADPTYLYEQVYNQGPFNRAKLLGNGLSQIECYYNGKLCIMTITPDMMRATQTSEEHTEGFVEQTMSIVGVRMGVLVVEMEDMVKMSFRSKDSIPVNILAEHFGGGGHLNAAGARVRDQNVNEVVNTIVQLAGPYLAKENKA